MHLPSVRHHRTRATRNEQHLLAGRNQLLGSRCQRHRHPAAKRDRKPERDVLPKIRSPSIYRGIYFDAAGNMRGWGIGVGQPFSTATRESTPNRPADGRRRNSGNSQFGYYDDVELPFSLDALLNVVKSGRFLGRETGGVLGTRSCRPSSSCQYLVTAPYARKRYPNPLAIPYRRHEGVPSHSYAALAQRHRYRPLAIVPAPLGG